MNSSIINISKNLINYNKFNKFNKSNNLKNKLICNFPYVNCNCINYVNSLSKEESKYYEIMLSDFNDRSWCPCGRGGTGCQDSSSYINFIEEDYKEAIYA